MTHPAFAALLAGVVALTVVAAEPYVRAVRRRQHSVDSLLRPNFAPSDRASAYAPTLMRYVDAVLSRFDRRGALMRLLANAEAPLSAAEAVVLTLAVCALSVALLMLFVQQPWLALVAGLVLPPAAVLAWLFRRRAAARTRLIQQLPIALSTIANAMEAGSSLPQALDYAAELPAPIGHVFKRACAEYHIGRTLDVVLADLEHQLQAPVLEAPIAAMLVHRAGGGDLPRLLLDSVDLLSEDLRLHRDLRVQTAQMRLSAQIVGALPMLLLIGLQLVSPATLEPFFSSLFGVVLLFAAAVLDLVGFLLVLRAGHVEF